MKREKPSSKENIFLKRQMTLQGLEGLFATLEKQHPGEHELRRGANQKGVELLNEETKLVIVGTVIPSDIPFFYTGSNRLIYSFIDECVGSHLAYLAARQDVETLKAELMRLHIAFLDVADWCVNLKGSHKDADVQGFTVDKERLEKLKDLVTRHPGMIIVPSSNCAYFVLRNETGLDKEPRGLNAQKSKEAKKQEWVPIIREALLGQQQ